MSSSILYWYFTSWILLYCFNCSSSKLETTSPASCFSIIVLHCCSKLFSKLPIVAFPNGVLSFRFTYPFLFSIPSLFFPSLPKYSRYLSVCSMSSSILYCSFLSRILLYCFNCSSSKLETTSPAFCFSIIFLHCCRKTGSKLPIVVFPNGVLSFRFTYPFLFSIPSLVFPSLPKYSRYLSVNCSIVYSSKKLILSFNSNISTISCSISNKSNNISLFVKFLLLFSFSSTAIS